MTFEPYKTKRQEESLPKISPLELGIVIEKYRDDPQWLQIKGYRESKATGKSELILGLNGKDYWFPLNKDVYESFVRKIRTESRGEGLSFLRSYIRESRGYKGTWPDLGYVRKNRIKFGFAESQITPGQVGISAYLIDSILRLKQEGVSSQQIAHELRLSLPQVESVINLDTLFDTKLMVDPKNKAFLNGEGPYEEMGTMSGEVARSRSQSVKAFKATNDKSSGGTPVRLSGMKPRAKSITVKRSML